MFNNVEDIVNDFETNLLNLLQSKLTGYPKGIFCIDEVFEKEWSRIPASSTRKSLGRKFADLVTMQKIKDVEFSAKSSSNKQYYEKK